MEATLQMDNRSLENRKHVRYQIDHDSIPIFDLGAASSLGQVENITIGGFLLKSDQAMTPEQKFHILIPVPGQLDERCAIRCTARSLWSNSSEKSLAQGNQPSKYYWNGYEFLDMTETGVETIEALIAILGRTSN